MPIVRSVEPNESAIEALPLRNSKYEIGVVQHRGLIVRVWPNGTKRFVYRRRQDGRLLRVALGATDLVGAVREWAAKRRDTLCDAAGLGGEQRGTLPARQRNDRRNPTIAQLVDRFMEERARPQLRSSRSDYILLVKYVLPAWGDIKVSTLRRGDVHALVNGIARKSPLQANRILAAVRKLFAFAEDGGVLKAHACVTCPVTHCIVADRTTRESTECASDCRPRETDGERG